MFEQHPVPQQISSYQFRLVGDMTLKQFFQLAAGAVVGLIVYSLPLPGFLKWPFIAIAVIGGAAFAFLPIQNRPLEQWLVAFFRSIYAPTIFVWQKPSSKVVYFATDAQATQPAISDQQIPDTLPTDVATHALEQNEQNYLSRLTSLFGQRNFATGQNGQTPTQPQPAPMPNVDAPAQKPPEPPKTVQVKPQGYTPPAPTVPTQTTPLGQVFNAADPQTTPSHVAQFSPEAAPPTPPTLPNIIVGQVMDVNGKIVEGAILEITDSGGRPVRALKTNKAGHFMIVTPLPDGDYQLTIEKNDLEFEPVTVKLAGAVMAPIAIKSADALPEPQSTDQRAVWSPVKPGLVTGQGAQ